MRIKLFEIVPEEFFSVLASPNKYIYADALENLYLLYFDNLKITEAELYTAIRGNLEEQLVSADFRDEGISEDELRDISGRARFLIRRLGQKGWFEKERGQDFEEYITIPEYSGKILETLHLLRDQTPARGYSYVFGTYSLLKTADASALPYEKMIAIETAYENTQALVKTLKSVYHNIKHYFQLQIELHDLNRVLASHFDDFSQKVVETYIRPLKIKDSIPKYRVPIQEILDRWLDGDENLNAMANAALQDRRGDSLDACRSDLLRKIYWVKDRYESIESEFVSEIDLQVRRYTRATTQKIESLTNRDHNLRGDIDYLLTALSRNRRPAELLEAIRPTFHLYEQAYLAPESLWARRRGMRRIAVNPIKVEQTDPSEALQADLMGLTRSPYGKLQVRDYVQRLFESRDSFDSSDFALRDDRDYIMSLLAVVNSEDKDAFYTVESADGSIRKEPYTVPQLTFRRKEEKK